MEKHKESNTENDNYEDKEDIQIDYTLQYKKIMEDMIISSWFV